MKLKNCKNCNKYIGTYRHRGMVLCEDCGRINDNKKHEIKRRKLGIQPRSKKQHCSVCGEYIGDYRYNEMLLCLDCGHDYSRKEATIIRRNKGIQLMSENKECASYLGVYIAESVLYNIFDNVIKMPYNNPGFDFICNGGYKIDVKASCRRYYNEQKYNWTFSIRKNCNTDYFLLVAFDDREFLNPEHLWLIPSDILNKSVSTRISNTTLSKWNDYLIDDKINELINCCNILKGE